MKKPILKLIILQIITGVLFLLISAPFHSCKPDEPECDTCNRMVVYKPNIYIYPTERSQIGVNLSFPHGGKIITSYHIMEMGG